MIHKDFRMFIIGPLLQLARANNFLCLEIKKFFNGVFKCYNERVMTKHYLDFTIFIFFELTIF